MFHVEHQAQLSTIECRVGDEILTLPFGIKAEYKIWLGSKNKHFEVTLKKGGWFLGNEGFTHAAIFLTG